MALAARAVRLEAGMSAAVTRVTAALPMIGAEEAAAALETAVPITMKGHSRRSACRIHTTVPL
jgi:hypothetical protein